MKIILKDIINSRYAVSNEQGELVYNSFIKYFKSGALIELDFSSIKSTIAPFFYSCYGILFKDYSLEEVEEKIKFLNITNSTEITIKIVKDISLDFYKNKRAK